jgi:hypothetical protein
MTILENAASPQTLALRMSQGRIPVADALRYAMALAEALRKIHESGHVHGAVSPGVIAVSPAGLELLPALGSVGEISAYTAPEVVEGRAPDVRSDVYSFGVILYELLTGRAAAIPPPPSGSPAVDRLVGSCVAAEPGARLQGMQKLRLELKLLAVAIQHAESAANRRELPDPLPIIRAEIQQLTAELGARIDRIEATQRKSAEAITQLERGTAGAIARVEQAAAERIARAEQSLGAVTGRIGGVEGEMDAIRRDTASLRESVCDDFAAFDKSLKSQGAAIESARTAIAQTDDLVERVVEALESLQTAVLDRSADRFPAAN